MIPEHNHSGVLPPFLPDSTPANPSAMAPYKVSMLDIVHRFAVNEPRTRILNGLLVYRKALREAGIVHGFQWIDGSFVEDVELVRGRPPLDIDVTTFAPRPDAYLDHGEWRKFLSSRPDLFDPEQAKKVYLCDAYFVDLLSNPMFLVSQTRYWFGLFSHQRDTFLWKGMLEVSMAEDDAEVIAFLNQGGTYAA